MNIEILIGDALGHLRDMPDNSVDSIVTDPPYGLSDHKPGEVTACLMSWIEGKPYEPKGKGFMGKKWDAWVPGPEVWRECMRVLKPGGHLLAFAGTRSMDLMSMAVRLAGFELRDAIGYAHDGTAAPLLAWTYGSGFPKSMDVSKAIDKAEDYKLQAAHRRAWVEAVQEAGLSLPGNSRHDWTVGEHAPGDKWWAEFEAWIPGLSDEKREAIERLVVGKGFKPRPTFHTADIGGEAEANAYDIIAPVTDSARQWQGWGTALKPAWEPIILARKPLEGTVAANVLAHGTGGLNIDGCRVDGAPPKVTGQGWNGSTGYGRGDDAAVREFDQPSGRFPANLIHDGSDEVLALFPESKGQQGDVRGTEASRTGGEGTNCYGEYGRVASAKRGDTGSAARFFYCAKASKRDRDEGLDEIEAKACGLRDSCRFNSGGRTMVNGEWVETGSEPRPKRNIHPTVKPTALMRYLCRLVTPPGGLVLDPFTGSGSTGRGAVLEGFEFIGIELDPDYAAIARARIAAVVKAPVRVRTGIESMNGVVDIEILELLG